MPIYPYFIRFVGFFHFFNLPQNWVYTTHIFTLNRCTFRCKSRYHTSHFFVCSYFWRMSVYSKLFLSTPYREWKVLNAKMKMKYFLPFTSTLNGYGLFEYKIKKYNKFLLSCTNTRYEQCFWIQIKESFSSLHTTLSCKVSFANQNRKIFYFFLLSHHIRTAKVYIMTFLKIFSSLAPYREQISGFASIFQKFWLNHKFCGI